MELLNNSDQNFIISEPVDFSVDTDFSPREVSIYSRDSLGVPQFFLLRKIAKAFAGKIVTKNFTVGTATPYYKIALDEKNVVNIISSLKLNIKCFFNKEKSFCCTKKKEFEIE